MKDKTRLAFNAFVDAMKEETDEIGTKFSLFVDGTLVDLGGNIKLVSMDKNLGSNHKSGKQHDILNAGGLYL